MERLLKKGFEVLYLVEPIDEHTIQNLPDFDGKKFQNAVKVMMSTRAIRDTC